MKRIHLLSSVVFGLSASVVGVGCQDSFKDCNNTRTCPPPDGDGGGTSTGGGDGDGDTGGGDGDGDGDTGGTGGTPGTGGTGDGDGDSTGGMGGDPNDPCLLCEADEYCTSEKACVGCLNDNHCGDASVCDPSTWTCVGCIDETDCEDPAQPICDGNVCVAGCTEPAECERFVDAPVCDGASGECVGCLPSGDDRTVDDDQCGTGVCNPVTLECDSTLTQMDKDVCESCIADSECAVDHNCVPMEFQGEPRTGGYCLKTTTGGCSQPFSIDLDGRASLSGVMGGSYCGINEALVTCEAVNALLGNVTCINDGGCPEGGLCRKVGSLAGNRCTYACSGPASECLNPPTAGSTCGAGTTPDPVSPDYCGGG